jgi:hypothetical protein
MDKTLNNDLHPLFLNKGSMIYLLNGDISSHDAAEQTGFVQNTLSNELCYRFTKEFMGAIPLDGTDVVLFEGTGDDSKIILLNTETCKFKLIAKDPCLNFQATIKGKYRKTSEGRVIYFGNKNRFNFLNIDCPPKKRKNDCQECLDEYENCIDCDALNINRHINIPCVELSEISGNMPNGSYQFAIGFSDEKSTQTEYFILPQVIKLFDKDNRPGGINISFNECFTTYFDEFELVLIANRDSGQTYQRLEYLNTSIKSYAVTELDSPKYTPLDIQTLLSRGSYYQGFKFIAENNESLILGAPCTRKSFDYRSLANQIEIEPVIMSVRKEDAHLYPSLLRDEVYPFDIEWVYPDGQTSHKTHIPNIVSDVFDIYGTSFNATVLAPDNLDHYERNSIECNTDFKKVFEIYNNGTITFNTDNCADCTIIEVGTGTMSYWESQEVYPDDYPDLGCTPIKYHKMPDDCIAPIIENGCVNILTIRAKNVQPPLDCDGNEIPMLGYRILVGDRTNHKSILHKGLVYNMGVHETDCENILYPNFPFNDLNKNKFLATQWERGLFNTKSTLDTYSDNQFTYHSPDIHYVKGQQGEVLKIYTEAIGKTQGIYHYTEDYPKFQILSSFGNLITQIAGFVEATILLNGEECETVVVEKECNKKVERVTDVTDFPVPNITGGATINTINSPGTSVINTSINTSIDLKDYTQTEAKDADCTTTYEVDLSVGATTLHEGFQDSLPAFDLANPYGKGTKCFIEGKVLGTVPDATSITFCYTEGTSSGSTQKCKSALVKNNKFTIEIPTDCDDIPGLTQDMFTFDPQCDCTGDTKTTTKTETVNCETRIDFINKLPDFSRLPATMYYYMQGQSAVNDFLKALLKPTNYAVQYTAEAEYDHHVCNNTVENKRREITSQVYLTPIKQRINGEYINNWSRESSNYLLLGEDLARPTNTDFTSVLHSEVGCDGTSDCENNVQFPYNTSVGGNTIQAVSYYTGLVRYLPSQYGQLNDYSSKATSCLQTNTDSDVIFAGDVFITKMSVKRKMPLFSKLPLGLPNNVEWDMRDYRNVAFPTYWLNSSQESVMEDILEIVLPAFSGQLRDYSLDLVEGLGECYTGLQETLLQIGDVAGGVFNPTLQLMTSLLLIGNPSNPFINPIKLNGIFYTHVTGIASFWCESEFQSSYRECNQLNQSKFYPELDLEELSDASEFHLPEQFLYNLQYNWQGLSKQTTTVTDFCEETFLDYLAYSNKNNEEQLGDEWLNYPPLNYQSFSNNNGKLTVIKEINDYNLFVGFEDAAYVTQQDEGLLTSDGNLIIGSPNAFQRRLKKISTDSTGYGGVIDPDAVIMSRFGLIYPDRKRKKWLMYSGQLTDITGKHATWSQEFMNSPIIGVWDNFSENYYFSSEDWTLSYKPMIKDWVSYHSWIPQDYIVQPNTFMTTNSKGIWKHNKKYSYQTFYGDVHRFEVGILVKAEGDQKLQDIRVFSEWYQNKGYDAKVYHRDKFFDELLVYNNCSSTNIQPLVVQTNNALKEGVTASLVNCDEWRINKLTDNHSKQPFVERLSNGWDYADTEDIKRDATLDGRWFKIHLRSNNYPDLKKLVEITLNKLDSN